MNLCMDIDEKLAVLKGTDLFASFQEATLRRLCEECNEVYLNANDTLFQEGSREDAMYLILQGHVLVFKRNRRIAELGPGQYLGEMALIESKPRSASVRAQNETLLMEITKFEFDNYLTAEPKALLAMIRTLSGRIRNDLEMISDDVRKMGILAHDMRNGLIPLGLVEGFFEDTIETMERAPAGAARDAELQRAREQLGLVVRVTDDMSSLIRQSLDQVKQFRMNYQCEVADLPALVRETVADLARHENLVDKRVDIDCPETGLQVEFNRLDIRRVLQNLIINAAQASPAGARIRISVLDLKDRIEVGVADEGPGVSPEIEPYLFKEPVTTRPDGVGLGLVSCREIIEGYHQGVLSHESEPDRGARFYFLIPKRRVDNDQTDA